ncbi:REP-associated tyrosine transposase [Parvularcula maris]|uniref:Transposase n=1 Tax=Parvularcula maris TaxID=2965077 RepID=A0A9X2RHT9_9PROT|nr:transposase [Parvularcula maris]MCQ8185219.1 transposase [Parvularcula maris]
MQRYRRIFAEGGTFAFTVCLKDRRSGLLTERMDDLRAAFRAMLSVHPVRIEAMCVMPDHLHTVWRLPEGDADYPLRWQLIKRRFAGRIGAKVWQRRYWEHTIRSEKDLTNHINYVHYNPVKHGHARDMDDWPHSSWHRWKVESGHTWEMPPEGLHL